MITDGITDGIPGVNNGLVQAPPARPSVNSASQTILSHMGGGGRAIYATGKIQLKVEFYSTG